MIRNQEIERLEDEICRIERDAAEQIHPLHLQMERIRGLCEHERDDTPGFTNPWWCGKCGGEIPKSPVHDKQKTDERGLKRDN